MSDNKLSEDKINQDLRNSQGQKIVVKPEDKDDEEQFIKKDGQTQESQKVTENIIEEINQELNNTQKNLEGVRPQSHQNRSLSHETGGMEAKEASNQEVKDAWDDRIENLMEADENAAEKLSDASVSTLRQSSIHTKKQKKKSEKEGNKAAQDSFEEMSYVERVKNMKEDRTGIDGKENKGGARM